MMQYGSSYVKSFNEPFECATYETDLEILRNLIEKGDPRAHYELGYLYEKGIGLPNDYSKAVCWYRSAAELGSAEAQLRLGLMYSKYDCMLTTPQTINHRIAFNLFYRSAVQENAAAENQLGNMYSSGVGVERDHHEAIYWYRRAAIQGNPDSHFRLSKIYKNAVGVKKNIVMAYIFEVLCSSHGNHEMNLQDSCNKLSLDQTLKAFAIAKSWRVGNSLPSYDI
ncbi:sel1 repeat family protein [Vreelandella andesensis]|uniref:Sel1 repeat family protein n=1 Tax=Vreelandella andesensis TaxID=447567 RepID=A0A433KSY4_9GAMM|nr:tetratricopeptide repeat protein [Halomonas andesensis]RUR32753.1 sel1 repeat family protein [Halomonas andesensis]